MYDIIADLKGIEAAIVERVTGTHAYVKQMDEHGSCKINFPTSGEVIVEYREGMIYEVRDGKRSWQHGPTCDLIRLLCAVLEQKPVNPLAAIAHAQRIQNIKSEIEFNMKSIHKWIKEM